MTTNDIDIIEARLIGPRHPDTGDYLLAAIYAIKQLPLVCFEVRELRDVNARLLLALKAYDHFNRLGNDRDAYLSDLSDWTQGELPGEQPTPEKYGLEEPE